MRFTSALLLLVIMASCGGTRDKVDGSISFEGLIYYDVNLEYQDQNFRNEFGEYIDQKYGDEVILYISPFGLLKEFPNSGPMGMIYASYLVEQNEAYAQWRSLDTTYAYDASVNPLEFISKDSGPADPVLDYECKFVSYKGYEPIGKDTIEIKFTYSEEIYLNPAPFMGCKDFFTSDIYQSAQSIPLYWEMDVGPYIIKQRATRIEQKAVDKSVYDIDSDLPIKFD